MENVLCCHFYPIKDQCFVKCVAMPIFGLSISVISQVLFSCLFCIILMIMTWNCLQAGTNQFVNNIFWGGIIQSILIKISFYPKKIRQNESRPAGPLVGSKRRHCWSQRLQPLAGARKLKDSERITSLIWIIWIIWDHLGLFGTDSDNLWQFGTTDKLIKFHPVQWFDCEILVVKNIK